MLLCQQIVTSKSNALENGQQINNQLKQEVNLLVFKLEAVKTVGTIFSLVSILKHRIKIAENYFLSFTEVSRNSRGFQWCK